MSRNQIRKEDKKMATISNTPGTMTMNQAPQFAIDLKALARAAALKEVRQGLTMLVIGLVITVGTYAMADAAGGGLFLISFAPIYGIYHTLHGLWKLATA
ncbi:MAG TPA: hypothetical protein VGF08_12975 [Terriglobales bacterium]|jgi:hypothetical protein